MQQACQDGRYGGPGVCEGGEVTPWPLPVRRQIRVALLERPRDLPEQSVNDDLLTDKSMGS